MPAQEALDPVSASIRGLHWPAHLGPEGPSLIVPSLIVLRGTFRHRSCVTAPGSVPSDNQTRQPNPDNQTRHALLQHTSCPPISRPRFIKPSAGDCRFAHYGLNAGNQSPGSAERGYHGLRPVWFPAMLRTRYHTWGVSHANHNRAS